MYFLWSDAKFKLYANIGFGLVTLVNIFTALWRFALSVQGSQSSFFSKIMINSPDLIFEA